MSRQYRRFDDEELGARRRSGPGVGTVVLATALGVGIGLLAAPETGTKTRRRLRQRMSTLGNDLEEGLEGVQEFGGRARERMRARLERLKAREKDMEDDVTDEEDDDEESRTLGTILALAAGAAASYFLSSERAAPARARARDAADTVRRQATDRWERFQQRTGDNGHTGSPEGSQSETTGGTRPSDEAPRGS
ncbi:MAG: YtxH domain-containing protein [Gemmatimonadales bacterium]|nr:YtxH domain-containing protein [Gemmatimonadales bacterium]